MAGRAVLAAAVLALGTLVPGHTVTRAALVDRLAPIEAYLDELESLRADFVQIAPDGALATGTLYYERPDKMRLDYDPPSQILIVANGITLTYYDGELRQVNRMFTSQTPLAFLLADEIRLTGDDVEVTDVHRVDDEIEIAVVQADDPNEGSIRLVFGADPLQLRRWAVTDAQGLTTQIVLENVETGVSLDDELFVFRDPDRYSN